MLRLLVFENGQTPSVWPLRNAYLIGADGNPVRGTIAYEEGQIVCAKRDAGAAAFAVQHRAGDLGELTLQTCLLPEREEPYLLGIELARHRVMTLYTKLEEWGMFDLDPDHPVSRRAEAARKLFIEALCLQNSDPQAADKKAHECLAISLDGSEELALAHSELLLVRRRTSGAIPRYPVGCTVALDQNHQRLRAGVTANFDFVNLPTPWKKLTPEEGGYNWDQMDQWMDWARKSRLPVVAGPIVSFSPDNLPDWLYIWEHDYDTVRDLIYEHTERLVERYKDVVTAWNVVSGLHVNDHFTFNFEQLMDLTRMATMLVKKLHPNSRSVVELRQPFGEYYAANTRSIPPMMYADLLVQSAIQFDAFGVHLSMGQPQPGQYTRDLMQISNLLDQFSVFGKPVYLTVGAPSEPVTSMMVARTDSNEPVDDNSGFWRRPWSPVVQSHWLEAVFQVALSKPFVEAVTWQDLVDHPNIGLPLGGLITEQLQPKAAFRRLATFRQSLGAAQRRAAERAAAERGAAAQARAAKAAEGEPAEGEPAPSAESTPPSPPTTPKGNTEREIEEELGIEWIQPDEKKKRK